MVNENSLATEGGGHTYYQTLLKAINQYSFHPDIEIINLVFSPKAGRKMQFGKQVIVIRKSFFRAVGYSLLDMLYRLWYRTIRKSFPSAGDEIIARMVAINNRSALPVLIKENIDLVYYLKPEDNILDYSLIITHWDVGHRSMHAFPEVALHGNYAKREKYYSGMLNKAFLILCESEAGAKELLHYYAVNPDKVKVLPLFSGEVVHRQVTIENQQQILLQYHLQARHFFIYPAQFWAHKNHYNLVCAFHLLVKETGNESLKLVLCGTDKGNMDYIVKLVDTLGINGKVLFPGFVSDTVLYTFYKNAVALVMPTFLGPTNIPLIEAAHLGCAVLCSQLEGHFEILGDAALYFNPMDMGGIKSCLQQVLQPERGKQLAEAALQRIKTSCFNIEKSIPVLQQILLKIKPARKAWGIQLSFIFSLITANSQVVNHLWYPL